MKSRSDKKKNFSPTSKPAFVWQLQSAKARFSELFRLVHDKGPQFITRQGRDTVVVMKLEEYEKLLSRANKPLIDFFRQSPLVGVELDLTRSKDSGRDIEI
jgi:prevent-host-death family protein